MRHRPSKDELIKKFIDKAETEKEDASQRKGPAVAQAFRQWPMVPAQAPRFAAGSELSRPINLPLKEFEWNTLDQHVKKIGVSKSKWIRHAIYALLAEEQNHMNE
tara:strand:- start:8160 stop:8474 length:315 start_codon:yes stop_codon:yes gene_type:complete